MKSYHKVVKNIMEEIFFVLRELFVLFQTKFNFNLRISESE
jgi:hypothetical protein